MSKKTVLVSGGFDPIHAGHNRLFTEAATYGDVIVALNSDSWLERKKGFHFMSWDERAELLRAFRSIADVMSVDDSDDTVCEAICRLQPTYFANGGDRTSNNTPELDLCHALKINTLFNVGGGKVNSSSQLIQRAQYIQRSWGQYEVLCDRAFKVKILTILPGHRLSLQRHRQRAEHWYVLQGNGVARVNDVILSVKRGDTVNIPIEAIHQLTNNGDMSLVIVEVQTGTYFGEDDIERLDTGEKND